MATSSFSSLHLAPNASSPSLEKILHNSLNAVNCEILARMQSPVLFINTLAEHIIGSGGKRLRPLLALASGALCQPSIQDVLFQEGILLAACVEFIHTATLLHDDVVDQSNVRRGLPSANALWGNQASVLVGDFLFSRAFEVMVEIQSFPVLQTLSQASSTLAQGEVAQLTNKHNVDLTLDQYFEVIKDKTAILFSAACRCGALLGGGSPETITHMARFGMNLGIAFQIVDDILDYTADAAISGKTPGADFREGKVTLPIILARNTASEDDLNFWRSTFTHSDNVSEEDFLRTLDILNANNIFPQAQAMVLKYTQQACDALDAIDTPYTSSEHEELKQSLKILTKKNACRKS